MSVMTPVQGSGGYVAVEQLSGTLGGRSGAFALQHFGVTHRDRNTLVLEVVPDSGTGRLAGLSGKMTIGNENGSHTYELDYSLAE